MRGKIHDNSSSLSNLKPLVKRLTEIKKQAEAIGLFTDDRELLECTCGLIEDIAFDGRLFTCRKNDHAFKDTGLRFIKVNENIFCCPECKTKLKVELL
ncbi:MAG: hypothetical protein KKI20_03425 [Gammaproteobacteria bacterium]|nr:hypothetical protein [Gammaproteobacteria bacterium]